MFRYRHPEIRQEEDAPPWGRVLSAFFGSIVIGIILAVWAWASLSRREAELRPSHRFPEHDLGPRHEVGLIHEAVFDHQRPGQTLFTAQRAELEHFGVVNRDKGIVSIPIDDAIKLVVEGQGR